MKNKKGFTLIELLAVIVILGIIMLVAIPAVTGYISGARSDSYLNDAELFVDGVKNVAITKNELPFAAGQVALFRISGQNGLQLESGGKQSPYGKPWDTEFTYIAIANVDGSNYQYAFVGNDEDGNFIPLSTIEYLQNKSDFEVLNCGSGPASQKAISAIAAVDGESFTCEGNTAFAGAVTSAGFGAITGSTEQTTDNKIYINGLEGQAFYVVHVYSGNGTKIS